jgi:mannosyltransferase OCH1-like enzyme
MESWIRLNPEWEYWFWSDEDIRAFIASAYPDYLALYDAYPGQGYRVDFFR